MNVELVYDNGCPNIKPARTRLAKALKQADTPIAWKEWERSDPAAPSYVLQYASPSILVNTQDVEPETAVLDGQGGCRLYLKKYGSIDCAPSTESIIRAVKSAKSQNKSPRIGKQTSLFSSLLAIAFAALPVGLCPACLPAQRIRVNLFRK